MRFVFNIIIIGKFVLFVLLVLIKGIFFGRMVFFFFFLIVVSGMLKKKEFFI